jgi:hypothetical protein
MNLFCECSGRLNHAPSFFERREAIGHNVELIGQTERKRVLGPVNDGGRELKVLESGGGRILSI